MPSRRRSEPDLSATNEGTLRLANNWVLSYDRSPVIEELYAWAERHSIGPRYSVSGKKRAWTSSQELVLMPAGTSRAGFDIR